MKKRIVSLDVFRFLLVTAALLSHVLGRFDAWAMLDKTQLMYLRLFTRGATPGLLILFGFMIEFVYVKYAQRHGLSYSVQRMTYRALLCYIALILIAAAGMFGLQTSPRGFLAAILLVAPTINGDVFAQYFYVLFAIMPIIALRLRFGLRVLLVAVAGIWLFDALVLRSVSRLVGDSLYALNLSHIVGFLLGIGDARGPSVFHGLTVVLFGMILGSVFASRSRTSIYCLIALTVIAAVILSNEIVSVGWSAFLGGIADYDAYRAHNSPVYFAYGGVYTLFVMVSAYGINKLLPQQIRGVATYLGSRTFIYFLVGNMILNLIPNGYTIRSLGSGVGVTIILIAICYFLIRVWESHLNVWQPIALIQRRLFEAARVLTTIFRRLTSIFRTRRAPTY